MMQSESDRERSTISLDVETFSIAHTVRILLQIDPVFDSQSTDAGYFHPHPADKNWDGCESPESLENQPSMGR